ncbi:MAG: hypothetical protein U0T82_11175 [Bacteroidales bacterium]
MRFLVPFIMFILLFSCREKSSKNDENTTLRFFSDSSFWNQPIPADAEIDSLSDYYIGLLKKDPSKHNFGMNLTRYTIPVYEVNDSTPRYKVRHVLLSEEEQQHWKADIDSFGHGPDFDAAPVPIPLNALVSPGTDRHLAVIDRKNGIAWDMWAASPLPDGGWCSNTGMKYDLYGSGVYNPSDFNIKNGESIHFYGPGRAAGVPIIAGLIMLEEVKSGEIRHKIAAATRFNAFQEFVFPATWTDGLVEGGIPEGAVIRLDPKLDLSKFDLLPGELIIAKALQVYGMVIVDEAGGNVIYGELEDTTRNISWKGIAREWDGGIVSIPLGHYQVMKIGETVKLGDAKRRFGRDEVPEF